MFFRLFKEGFYFAINSIIVNKLRTFLSLFGITIGIFSIISVFTVLDWMAKSIRDSIATMGDNVLFVQKIPWSFSPDMAWWDIMKRPPISKDDYLTILNRSTKTEFVCLTVRQQEQVKYNKNIAGNISIWATTQEFEKLRAFEIENGRYFSPEESASGRNICIVGSVLAKRLFDRVDPVGKRITIEGKKTYVIGILKKEGEGGLNESLDEKIIIPFNFSKTFINMRNSLLDADLMCIPKDEIPFNELSDETTMILRAARRLRPDQLNNFSINRTTMLSQGFDAVFAAINFGGWIIGGFAVLVGGFGIANIMFVSVRERTNQIGIQKALGAKRFFILQQFLVESVLLSVIGGLLGIFMIFLTTLIINYLYDMNIYLTVPNMFLAIVISGLIGVIAGYAPANSAAKMNPVEAIGFSF
jgi:putative ABC transport system permease protein